MLAKTSFILTNTGNESQMQVNCSEPENKKNGGEGGKREEILGIFSFEWENKSLFCLELFVTSFYQNSNQIEKYHRESKTSP